ncbi:MAG: phosphoribosylanthranilate isomerase [Citromicrobium sp.]|nr:MAG: phosphoribosylanthranilate isomerase [Citromicrobium sp.]
MPIEIKICGLNSPEAIDSAVDAGATHLGLIHFASSPRHVELDAAARLRARVPRDRKVVLLTVELEAQAFALAVQAIQPDVVQFHGREHPDYVAQVRQAANFEVWKAVGLRSAKTLENAAKWQGKVDRLIFDAPAKALPGGNGEVFDWTLLANHDHQVDWGLAGGLTPANVAEAIRVTGAPLVDTASGVESSPGIKDPGKIRAFCEAARNA